MVKVFEGREKTISEALKYIPPCSIGCEGGENSNAHKLIAGYYPLWKRVLEKKSVGWWEIVYNILTHPWRKVPKDWAFHMFTYFGGGKHAVVETIPVTISWWPLFKLPHGQVRQTLLEDKIKKDSCFKLFYNTKMTVEGLQKAKEFAYEETMGREYDIKAFVGFLDTNLNKEYNQPNAYICVENSIETVRKGEVTFLNNISSSRIHPQQGKEYLESDEGKNDGWKLCFDWDGGQATVYD